MDATPPEPPKRSPRRLLLIRLGILAFGAWAVFMGWQMAQLPPEKATPEAASPTR